MTLDELTRMARHASLWANILADEQDMADAYNAADTLASELWLSVEIKGGKVE